MTNIYPINPNFNSKTFFLDKNTSIKKQQKSIKKEDAFIFSGLTALGGISGGIIGKRKYPGVLNSAYKKLDSIKEEIETFALSPENQIKNPIFAKIKRNPYENMIIWLRKMDLLKEMPLLEKPNCLLFVGKDENKTKDAIDWFMKTAKQNNHSIDLFAEDFDFVEYLEQAEEQFQKTGKWNLIYVKNMDKAINPSEVEPAVIASMKSIMCATEKNFHTTLLFQTKDAAKLDDIATESNRINGMYDIDSMVNFDKFKNLYKKYFKQQDCIEKIEKSKMPFILKGAGIGIAVGAIITGIVLILKNKLNNKNIKGEKSES